MLGVSFFEFLIVFIVAMMVIKPSDLPRIISGYKSFIKKFTHIKREFREGFRQVHNEIIGMDSEKGDGNYHYVLDDDNKLQKAYDIEDLKRKQ